MQASSSAFKKSSLLDKMMTAWTLPSFLSMQCCVTKLPNCIPFSGGKKATTRPRNASIYVAATAVAGFKPFSQQHKVTLQVWSRGFLLRVSINLGFFANWSAASFSFRWEVTLDLFCVCFVVVYIKVVKWWLSCKASSIMMQNNATLQCLVGGWVHRRTTVVL